MQHASYPIGPCGCEPSARSILRKLLRDNGDLFNRAIDAYYKQVNNNWRTSPKTSDPLDAAIALIESSPDNPR